MKKVFVYFFFLKFIRFKLLILQRILLYDLILRSNRASKVHERSRSLNLNLRNLYLLRSRYCYLRSCLYIERLLYYRSLQGKYSRLCNYNTRIELIRDNNRHYNYGSI
jgi:hypothetical protein